MMKLKTLIVLTMALTMFIACQSEPETAIYQINPKTSTVEWKGNAPHHFHSGSFDVSGEITLTNDSITGGGFTIPITSITNYELPEAPKEQLLAHLKGPDFFNIAVHPNAKFKITGVKSLVGDSAANYQISGDFTLIGQTHPLSFPAKITKAKDSLNAIAEFKFNRLQWGMSSYNDPKQQMYILPDIEIKLNLQFASKAK
jgi:polyisoprenoid-binding protein YceI